MLNLCYIIDLVQWVYYSSISQKRKLWLREAYSKLFKYTQLESGGTGFQFLMDSATLSAPWAAHLGVLSLERRQRWSPGQNGSLQDPGSSSLTATRRSLSLAGWDRHTQPSCWQPFGSHAERTCVSPVCWTVRWMSEFPELLWLHLEDGPALVSLL